MKALRLLGLAVALLAPLIASPTGAYADDPLTVPTTAGLVHGLTVGSVDEWRGLPYAAPPVGQLRWRPPAPVTPWPDVRAATGFRSECAQPSFDGSPVGSEDCLYLNVFTPTATLTDARLPVMVHLHGGSNSVFHPYTNADAFAARGVIVVTLAYRLGAFGFVGHPALSAEGGGSSGEYGVLDQIAALHWVRDNIQAFGGDPGNVTLFGESAGSFDAVAIAASPLGAGLFTRLAAQTESFWAGRGHDTIADAEQYGQELADAVGCSGASDVAACLRALPTDTLVAALGFIDVAPWVGGAVLPASPLELIAAQPRRVPMLLGSNREEAVGFLPVLDQDNYRYADWVRDAGALVGPTRGAELGKLYPVKSYDSAFWSATAMFSDAIYTCPMRRLALTAPGPVYRYLFTHRYDNSPYLALGRAAHFFDEPLLWHDAGLFAGLDYTFSPREEALSSLMTDYWTNFAKTGNPNGAGLPQWQTYTAATERITVLDDPPASTAFYHRDECRFLDAVPDLFAPPRYVTPRWMAPGTSAA